MITREQEASPDRSSKVCGGVGADAASELWSVATSAAPSREWLAEAACAGLGASSAPAEGGRSSRRLRVRVRGGGRGRVTGEAGDHNLTVLPTLALTCKASSSC